MSTRVAVHRGIRAIREAKGLTQGEVATAAFISSGQLNNIEAGRRTANEDVIALLARALNVELDAISYIPESETTHA